MRKVSRGRLLAMAAGAALAVGAAQKAHATFQYQMTFDDDQSSTKTITAPGTYTIDLWAILTDADGNKDNDGVSTDTLSIISKPGATGSGIAAGGVIAANLDSAVNVPPQAYLGSANKLNNDDAVTDWGGTDVNKPTDGYFRYLAFNANAKGYRINTVHNDKASKSAPPYIPGTVETVSPNTYRILVGWFDVKVDQLGPKDSTTTFVPVSGVFDGVNQSYGLSYFNDDPGVFDGSAVVKKTQLPALGVTFVSGTGGGPVQLTLVAGTGAFGASVSGAASGLDAKVDKAQTAGALGTHVQILGTSNPTAQVTLKARIRAANETFPTQTTPPVPNSSFGLISDVVDVSGFGAGDKYVLQLSYDPAAMHNLNLTEAQAAEAGFVFPAELVGGMFVKAGTGAPALRAYNSTTDGLTTGAWGVDTANGTVWVVLDHNGTFAVVPEPAALGLLGLASLGLLARKRSRKA